MIQANNVPGGITMEFKDRLKELRLRHKLSQSQLAEAIFVSRSAVAKWENGLGYPSEDSLQALTDFFCVPPDHFSTQEPEVVIVEKNRRINHLTACLVSIACAVGALVLSILILLLAGYRFTSASAVDSYYHKYPTIRTEGYDFYFNDKAAPTGVEVVKKYGPWLFKNIEHPMQKLVTSDGNTIGAVSILSDRDCYHYLFFFTGYITGSGYTEDGKYYTTVNYPYRTGKVTLNGTELELDLLVYTSHTESLLTLYIKGERIILQPFE